ncbi:hypothetical protein HK096_010854 [Nowakowskiella sp. JEL0078]|nr:hypothetical protein HK096_010854 [Nowakowskiella sp. JEL0078]
MLALAFYSLFNNKSLQNENAKKPSPPYSDSRRLRSSSSRFALREYSEFRDSLDNLPLVSSSSIQPTSRASIISFENSPSFYSDDSYDDISILHSFAPSVNLSSETIENSTEYAETFYTAPTPTTSAFDISVKRAKSFKKAKPTPPPQMPTRIFRLIFQYLSQHERLKLLQVCYVWSRPAAEAFYQSPPLDTPTAFARLTALLSTSGSLDQQNNGTSKVPNTFHPYHALVRELYFTPMAAEDLYMGDVDRALALCSASLVSFHLENCIHVSNLLVQSLARHAGKLRRLEVPGCNSLTDIFVPQLAACCAVLERIDLSFTNVTVDGSLGDLLEKCKYLASLDLSGCRQSIAANRNARRVSVHGSLVAPPGTDNGYVLNVLAPENEHLWNEHMPKEEDSDDFFVASEIFPSNEVDIIEEEEDEISHNSSKSSISNQSEIKTPTKLMSPVRSNKQVSHSFIPRPRSALSNQKSKYRNASPLRIHTSPTSARRNSTTSISRRSSISPQPEIQRKHMLPTTEFIRENLRYLTLRFTDTSDTHLIFIAERCPNIRFLNLESCRAISDEGIQAIATHCTSLIILDLSYCIRTTETAIKSLVTQRFLEQLHIKGLPHLTASSVQIVAKACPKLEKIDCSDSRRIVGSWLQGFADAQGMIDEFKTASPHVVPLEWGKDGNIDFKVLTAGKVDVPLRAASEWIDWNDGSIAEDDRRRRMWSEAWRRSAFGDAVEDDEQSCVFSGREAVVRIAEYRLPGGSDNTFSASLGRRSSSRRSDVGKTPSKPIWR